MRDESFHKGKAAALLISLQPEEEMNEAPDEGLNTVLVTSFSSVLKFFIDSNKLEVKCLDAKTAELLQLPCDMHE